jgi:hypothetical protein
MTAPRVARIVAEAETLSSRLLQAEPGSDKALIAARVAPERVAT